MKSQVLAPIAAPIEGSNGPLPAAFSREVLRGMTDAFIGGDPIPGGERADRCQAAFEALQAFNPSGGMEAMIAAQAVAAHAATMESFRLAMTRFQPADAIVRLRSNAATLMRTIAASLRTMERLRGASADGKSVRVQIL